MPGYHVRHLSILWRRELNVVGRAHCEVGLSFLVLRCSAEPCAGGVRCSLALIFLTEMRQDNGGVERLAVIGPTGQKRAGASCPPKYGMEGLGGGGGGGGRHVTKD